jgi:hypothetical protein
MEVHHVFLTSALNGSEWSASRPGRFTSRERAPATHWQWAKPAHIYINNNDNSNNNNNILKLLYQQSAKDETNCELEAVYLNGYERVRRMWGELKECGSN